MANENDPQLQMYEMMVRGQGPDVAFRNFAQVFGEPQALILKNAYERKIGIITSLHRSATLQDRRPDWYAGPSEDDRFWPALKRYLLNKKRWPETTVKSLDEESTNVMRLLPHVGGRVDVKGLVIGYVQSGKTANYTALIAKAADVGYRLIIVLAGIHNSLRRQTQTRLQAELIDADERIKPMWHTLTLAQEDFRARGTNTDAFLSDYSDQRILLVVKKNAHVLMRLIKWLKQAQPRLLETCPALIIDDEADQAGLNAGREERSTINRLILELKGALPKCAYVGYTATPFANVLVDPSGEDLYPSDFIVALNKPTDYFGAELFFGRDPLPDEDAELPTPPDLFRLVEAEEVSSLRPVNRAATEAFNPEVPASLRTAIEYFLLATAARWARGHRLKHSSMLVHTSMSVAVHHQLRDCIEKEIARIKKALALPATLSVLEKLWSEEHPKVRREGLAPVAFADVASRLPDVLQRLRVVMDNSRSASRLVYKEEAALDDADEVVHIAVGGNTLSRGLTIEGLIVSYFVRSASTYDTLLQMGRWFGYRFGYEDLPRIWMTEELRDAFHDLATVEEEIRSDVARYESEGRTPRDFAVRIRTHPTLAVTSDLKMAYAVPVNIDYSGDTRQTRYFQDQNDEWLGRNWQAAAQLVDQLANTRELIQEGSHRYWKGVPADLILKFLDGYSCHEGHTELRRELLKKYIQAQNQRDRAKHWTVALVSLKDRSKPPAKVASLEVTPVVRSKLGERKDGVDLGTITTQGYFEIDLTAQQKERPKDAKKRAQVVRPLDAEPLLLLIPIQRDSNVRYGDEGPPEGRAHERLLATRHIMGMALAFPTAPSKGLRENYIQVQLPPQPNLYVDEEVFDSAEDDG